MGAMKKSDFKMRIREEARRKVRGSNATTQDHQAFRDRIEAGRRELMTKSAQGGDGKAMRVKNELMYLINNYTPQYDMRIIQLIDMWRTSHDPSYDPGIQVQFRRARQEYERKSNAF
ncbi:MAG: hypothetical protein IT366_14405 [Candidatus Hydrogenedentes bacterium]|nr:hypothetical protein [Candidatus Hydrogenedentota bacterium]